MRFKRCPRHPFTDTARKRSAVLRKQAKERAALPLFAEQIEAQQPGVDAVMQARGKAWEATEDRDRAGRAATWRQGRAQLARYPDRIRHKLRIAWDCAPYPADPSRFLNFLHSYETGRLDLDALPFPLSKTDGSGARVHDLFKPPREWVYLNIPAARDVAATPNLFSLANRRAAYHHLQASADKNKDKDRAGKDRVLAAALYLRLGELEEVYYVR